MVPLQCLFCDHSNPAEAKFCNECGTPLHFKPCLKCDGVNGRFATSCYRCGAEFSVAAGEAADKGGGVQAGSPASTEAAFAALVALTHGFRRTEDSSLSPGSADDASTGMANRVSAVGAGASIAAPAVETRRDGSTLRLAFAALLLASVIAVPAYYAYRQPEPRITESISATHEPARAVDNGVEAPGPVRQVNDLSRPATMVVVSESASNRSGVSVEASSRPEALVDILSATGAHALLAWVTAATATPTSVAEGGREEGEVARLEEPAPVFNLASDSLSEAASPEESPVVERAQANERPVSRSRPRSSTRVASKTAPKPSRPPSTLLSPAPADDMPAASMHLVYTPADAYIGHASDMAFSARTAAAPARQKFTPPPEELARKAALAICPEVTATLTNCDLRTLSQGN